MGRKKKVVMDQLTIVSTNAIKAGMSYGKYMAWKAQMGIKNPPKPDEEEVAMNKRTCLNCGEEFTPRIRKDQKYCCDYCRNTFFERKKVTDRAVQKTCPVCGNLFVAFYRKYCGPSCVTIGKRQQAMERNRKALEAWQRMIIWQSREPFSRDFWKWVRCSASRRCGTTSSSFCTIPM